MAAKVQHFAHKTKINHEKLVQIVSFCFTASILTQIQTQYSSGRALKAIWPFQRVSSSRQDGRTMTLTEA
jgi:hypothetical protein